MKYGLVGLGLIALTSMLAGCSGTASTAPPKGDAGTQTDAGDASSDAGSLGEAGSASDAGNRSDASVADSGARDASQGEAGASGDSDAGSLPQICNPGELSCDGAVARACNAAGTGYTGQKSCSLSQLCKAGVCLDIGCVPDTTFCSNGDIWSCGTDGTTSTLTEHCAATQFCLEKDRVATCNATACFANDPMCVGNLATHCAPDGSGPKAGGDDCTASQQSCYSGECRDLVCTPGQKLCDNNDSYLCTDGGTSRTLLSTCAAGETCDSSSGTCRAKLCDPGTLGCDSTRVVTCNDSGTGWVQSGPDCAASSSVCSAGGCKPIICSVNQSFCQSDSVYICSADGTSSTLYQACPNYSEHCVPYGAGAYCNNYFCTPSAAGCNGNVLTTCAADGNSWVAGGTDCTLNNGICLNSKCTPKVCTPATQFCADGSVQACDYQGASFTQSKFCPYATYCRAQGSTADCVPTPCLPDSDGCAGEKFGHCASDGMSVGAGATDCGAATQVCTQQGCAASATDTLASTNQLEASTYYSLVANILSVDGSRKLTAIEMYLTLPTTRTLTWVVYQQNIVNGYPELDLKYQKATTGTGTGFQSSGVMSLELAAGKTYAIGVNVADGSFVDYFDIVATPPSLNFAHAIGSIATTFALTASPYGYTNKLYYSRLTTTAP